MKIFLALTKFDKSKLVYFFNPTQSDKPQYKMM